MSFLGSIKKAARKNNAVRRLISIRDLRRFRAVNSPRRLIFEPISACNYRCPKCIYPEMERAKRPVDLEKFRLFLTNWNSTYGPFESVEFTGAGEVLSFSGFVEMVAIGAQVMPSMRMVTTSNMGLFDVDTARKLVQNGLRSWQVSLDSVDPAEYALMVGVKSASVEKILKDIAALWQILQENPSPLNRLAILAHRPLDADYDRKCDEIESAVKGICSEFSRSPYQSLNGRKLEEQFVLSEKLLYRSDRYPMPCAYLWTDLVVLNDGTVRICCSDMFDSPVNFGNVFTDTPQQIVANLTRREYQAAHETNRIGSLYLCDKCHAPHS